MQQNVDELQQKIILQEDEGAAHCNLLQTLRGELNSARRRIQTIVDENEHVEAGRDAAIAEMQEEQDTAITEMREERDTAIAENQNSIIKIVALELQVGYLKTQVECFENVQRELLLSLQSALYQYFFTSYIF